VTQRSFRRLRTPVFALLFGCMISTAIGIGQSWIGAAITYAVTAMVSVVFLLVGRRESDLAAVLGGHADERQELVRLKAAHAALVTAVIATGIACLISAVVNAVFWPYEVIIDVVAVGYLVGLYAFGVQLRSETSDPADD
jgi:hypothetical protein